MVDINPQIIEAEIAQIGPQGIPGQAATITIGSVTTGAAGSSATVTNSGTSTAAVLDFVIPQGAKGAQGEQGQQGIQGLTGATGNGISSIAKIGTSGLVDTYRISLTDNTHFDFTVTNGSSISDIEKTGTSGLVDTYTITLTNGNTHTFTVTNGAEGEKGETGDVGNGILNILKMSTTGLVDNYRINFTNGTYFDFNVTNAKSITGVSLLSWEGLEKTYRITFNDGTYFDYVVTNGTGQVDWGGISGILSQQADLQEALDSKANMSQTHALKAYSDNGELLYDAEGLEDVTDYAHSTFDRSKFTVVGSPIVTDDGIASNCSTTNYFKIPNSVFSQIGSKPWKLEWSGKLPSYGIGGTQYVAGMDYVNNPNSFINIGRFNDGANFFANIAVNNNGTAEYLRLGYIWLNNTNTPNYEGCVEFDGSKYSYKIRLEGGEWLSSSTGDVTSSNILYPQSNDLYLLYNMQTGAFDFKELLLTVDGVPVFSGNRTGIDTIKPDDYTVVGTPTISADGVASGFSASNYIKTPTIDRSKPFEQIMLIRTGNTLSENGGIWCEDTNTIYKSRIQFSYGKLRLFLTSDGTSFDIANVAATTVCQLNQLYYIKLKWTGTHYLFEISTNGINYETIADITSSVPIRNLPSILGAQGTSEFNGSIDLNAFKIYVDGNLVYQPCLKIPYTQSKTGSKIVNAVYRDRVNDMADQFGYANYYTLDENNGNFTLPQVELPGLIGNKTLRDSYYNGVTYWELFSNRRLEQGGTCDSGVEYTLPKPFADANYVLTIPYSSKTATSFIPSATGDFIAKGMGLL